MTMTTCNTISRPVHPQRASVLTFISTAFATAAQRRTLCSLDAKALQDIGLTKSQAKVEANRPFWDVPATWRS